MKKKLILSTETFPYGKGEKTFILPELKKLAQIYDITIVSHAHAGMLLDIADITPLDPEIKVVNIDISINFCRRILYVLRYLMDVDGWKEIADIIKGKEKILTRIYQSIGFYALASKNFSCMKKQGIINRNEPIIYYTFWYYYYTYSMTKKKYKNVKIITRTHGFDLYNERYTGGRQPFKKLMTPNVDKIFFVSFAGEKYYKEHFEQDIENRGRVCRLGTAELVGMYEVRSEGEMFNLVSCSNVISLKRVELIVEALALLQKEKIRWIHFGGGEGLNQLEECADRLLTEKDNICYDLMGRTNNEEVLKYYHDNSVDCFITTSSTEGGTPVSIMEAMSVGIPVIGTNVGGIPEMLDGNGILLSANPTAQEIANAISYMYNMDYGQIKKMRDISYNIWKNNFSFKNNIAAFIKELQAVDGLLTE